MTRTLGYTLVADVQRHPIEPVLLVGLFAGASGLLASNAAQRDGE
jgi:hypothetical protein